VCREQTKSCVPEVEASPRLPRVQDPTTRSAVDSELFPTDLFGTLDAADVREGFRNVQCRNERAADANGVCGPFECATTVTAQRFDDGLIA
jgi:hypothetical protein